MTRLTRAIRRARQFIAIRLLRNSKTTRTRRILSDEGMPRFQRERSFIQSILIPIANGMLRSMHAHVIVLHGTQWKEWETAVWAALHQAAIRTTPRGLVIPEMPGNVLVDYLAGNHSDEEKLVAVKSCLTALCEAHRQIIIYPDGTQRPFSHGDATARNVLFDPASGRAHWIDFETIHSPDLLEDQRQSDDFRAFFVSMLEVWPDAVTHLHQFLNDQSLNLAKVRAGLIDSLKSGPANLYEEAQGSIPDQLKKRL